MKKENNLNYKSTFKTLLKILVPTISMLVILYILKIFLPFENLNKVKSILYITIYTLVGGIVYIAISFKLKLFNTVFGSSFINKLKKKLIHT